MDKVELRARLDFWQSALSMYGQITQIDYGSTEFASHAATRVPKFSLNQEADIRKLRLGARPLAAPHNYCPYIYAAEVVS